MRTLPASRLLALGTVLLASGAPAQVPAPGRSAATASVNDAALEAVVAAERAFAADAAARGIRESFLAAFAEDGVNFTPHAQKTREALLRQPASATPSAAQLDWWPAWADVSWAGDLGYTTGPYLLRDRSPEHRPERHGCYFSIWKRDTAGTWKVVVDAGIRTPEPTTATDERSFRGAPEAGRQPRGAALSQAAAEAAIAARERALATATIAQGPAALADFAVPETRLHRDGAWPQSGPEALRAALAGARPPVSVDVIGRGTAASGDLGYTWGRTKAADGDVGYFVRVWRRGADGTFRVTLDWANSVSRPQAP